MERVELFVEKKKAEKLISFLKELDFVEVKRSERKKKSSKEKLDDIIIPAINPHTDIFPLIGAWKNTKINASGIRKTSRKVETLKW